MEDKKYEFKAGDRVRQTQFCSSVKEGFIGTVFFDDGTLWLGGESGKRCCCPEYWELVGTTKQKETPVRFILEYQEDSKVCNENYSSPKSVHEGIRAIAENDDVDKDSIRVYQVTKVYLVQLERKVKLVDVTAKSKK